MPLGDGITFKYGDYQFDPRPLFTVNKETLKTPANTGLGTKYTVTLEGQILPTGINPIDGNVAGLTTVLSGTNVIRDAFAQDFRLLLLQCDSDGTGVIPPNVIISGYPKVIGVDVRNAGDNYVQRAEYTINLELPSLTGTSYDAAGIEVGGNTVGDLSASGLISLTDEFTVEFLDERIGGNINISNFGDIPTVFSLQRSVSAQGDSFGVTPDTLASGTGYREPWQKAKDYISANLGLTDSMTGLASLMCASGSDMNFSNNFRTITVNKTEGSVNATETWIASTGAAMSEDFEVSVDRSVDSPLTSISINGTIQGYSTIDYMGDNDGCLPTGQPKFNNALTAWSGAGAISGRLFPRVQAVYNSLTKHRANLAGSLNNEPLSESLGYNIVGGTITYSNSYDDRPANCYTGALTETISFSYNEPNDIFASLTILGRANGPLLQQIGTVGPRTRDLSIDAILPLKACDFASAIGANEFIDSPAVYDTLVSNYEARLNAEYSQVFVNSFSKSWEPKVGHFTLSKSWTVGSC